MRDKVSIRQIQQDAENFYRNGDYYCSEAIIASIRQHIAPKMPIEAISMGSGFPVGIGGTGCTCGALSGGIAVIGYFFGRTAPKDEKVVKAMAMAKELHDYFEKEHKIPCCRVLTKGMDLGSVRHMEQCIAFTGEMAAKTAEIIIRELNLTAI